MGDTATTLDLNTPKSKVQEYTGKITDNPAPPDEKYEEPVFAKEPPSSEIFGDNVSANPIITENRELQELHRSTNDPIDSQSNSTRISVGERPAAGAGGSSTNPPPATRGRRHIRTTIFENECNEYGLSSGPAAGLGPQFDMPNDNQEIFSIKGTRSIKINRHRDTVNVFPSGCMGIPQDALPKIPEDNSSPQDVTEPFIDLTQSPELSPKKDGEYNSAESTPRSINTPRDERYPSPKKNNAETAIYGEESPVLTPRSITQNCSYNSVQYRRSRPLSAVQRNPLTGVGYEDRDFIRQSTMKKRDGNPVLGQGYETKDLSNKSKKIPPGGYSRGLW